MSVRFSLTDVCRRIRVSGIVQGVGFRYYTRHQARSLGVTGWVRNCPDGSVEAVAAGSSDAVEAFTTWMRHGPSSARVDYIDVTDEPQTESFTSFDIR